MAERASTNSELHSGHQQSQKIPASAISDVLLRYRLDHGLCHGCGTRIYDMQPGNNLMPLTVPGLVNFGRCLFCYPDAPERYKREEARLKDDSKYECGQVTESSSSSSSSIFSAKAVSLTSPCGFSGDVVDSAAATIDSAAAAIDSAAVPRASIVTQTEEFTSVSSSNSMLAATVSPLKATLTENQKKRSAGEASTPLLSKHATKKPARARIMVPRNEDESAPPQPSPVQSSFVEEALKEIVATETAAPPVSTTTIFAAKKSIFDSSPIPRRKSGPVKSTHKEQKLKSRRDTSFRSGDSITPVVTIIRDAEGDEFEGTVIEGTAKKGRGTFIHIVKKGEKKGKKSVYTGEFANGTMEGKGYQKNATGCVYTGDFHRGASHGKGHCRWPGGWMYDGDWVMDMRDGVGKCYQNKKGGEIYEGEWKADMWHGQGELIFAGGGKFKGDFYENKIHGKGCYEFADGGVYVGTFQYDLREGLGEMTYADGTRFFGQWKKNWRDSGKLYFPDGRVFDGLFKDDEPYQGLIHHPNGDVERFE